MNDQEMIAAPLDEVLRPLCEGIANLCQCIQSYAQEPSSRPCETFPFLFRGSIVQQSVCHSATSVFQVPKAHVGVITRITFGERYPGTLYGANFFLLINDNFSPSFPRLDHTSGTGMERGIDTHICVEEQDIISIMLQCSWQPVVFSGIASTYTQMIYPFEISGYYEYKEVAA